MRQWWYGAARDATAVEPNQLTDNAVVNRPRLAVARERIPGLARKKKAESSAPQRESSSPSNGLSVAASESSFSTSESSSSSESETVVTRHANVARKKTSATAREKMAPDEPKENALVIQRRLAPERPRPSSPLPPWISSGSPPSTHPSIQTTEEAEKMAPDEPAESALVIQRQLARERPCPSRPPLPWPSSGSPHHTPPSLQTAKEVAGRAFDSSRQGLPTDGNHLPVWTKSKLTVNHHQF